MAKHLYSICAISLLLLVAGTPARADTPALHGGALLSCSGLPCVDITLKNGKHLRMLVDLGDVNSVIDSAAAKDMGLTVDPASMTGRDGKAVSGYGRTVLEDARMGDASLGDIHVLVTDLGPDEKKNEMPKADGILAYTAFHDRLLQIDYKHQMVRVSGPLTADPPCPGFCGDVTTPTFGKNGPPVLVTTGFSVNGKPITVQLDTLYIGSLLVYPTSVAKLDLQTENGASATQFFSYTDGGVPMREAHAHVESFGSKALVHNGALFFATPKVHVPDGMFDGTVGLGLLAGHVLNLDLHSNRFWMT